LATLIL